MGCILSLNTNCHTTLKSLLSKSVNQYITHSDDDTFVVDEIIEYCVGVDLYEFLSAPLSHQMKYNRWDTYYSKACWENAGKIDCYFLSKNKIMKQERNIMEIMIHVKKEKYVHDIIWCSGLHRWHHETKTEIKVTLTKSFNVYFNKLFGCKSTFDWGWKIWRHFNRSKLERPTPICFDICSKEISLYDKDRTIYIVFNAVATAINDDHMILKIRDMMAASAEWPDILRINKMPL